MNCGKPHYGADGGILNGQSGTPDPTNHQLNCPQIVGDDAHIVPDRSAPKQYCHTVGSIHESTVNRIFDVSGGIYGGVSASAIPYK